MSKKLLLTFFIINIFTCTFIKAQIPVPETGCYHSAFTGNDTHQQFETLAQKNIAIEMFFLGWPSNFPASKCTEISNNGAIPHITWMPQVSGSPYPLDGIINGTYDNYIKSFADAAKAFNKPLFIRLGHEFNGDWYTYGGANNGGGTLNGFGDLTKADGPERFIAAYKRVHDLFAGQGVTNVVWIWCLNNSSSPNATWNVPEAYYPGDSYVDWIGFDGYNFGTSQTWSNWVGFWDIYYPMYSKFESYNKPMMIAEYASVENGGNKADWIRNAYLSTRFSFPKIKAITWFHIAKTEGTVFTDWRINSSSASLAAYQLALSDAYYLGSVITDVENEKENIPTEFSLQQNYPNPFNPTTKISFTIPNSTLSWSSRAESRDKGFKVQLKIFDILGNEVATLVDEYRKSGSYEVDFNVAQVSRPELASGIYFYRLDAGSFVETRKMIFLK